MIKVFLVDDHELVRTGIRHILQRAPDIDVVGEAASGAEALALAAELQPDVVLMDLRMPGMGGIEATRQLLKQLPRVRVIALTMVEDAPFPARISAAGARGYLTKGGPAEEMLTAIRTVHRGRPFVAAAVANRHMLANWQGMPDTPFADLTAREMDVLLLTLQGRRSSEIARELQLSPKTVSSHRQRIFEKLNVKNDVELTRLAYRHGVIDESE
jgi:two-component system invasion response regulator UvrY